MNVPNTLSSIRILLVPIIVLLMILYPMSDVNFFIGCWDSCLTIKEISIPWAWISAFILFIIACITDFIDGYIARKYKKITELGKFLDPVADKILITSVMIVMAVSGILPVWILIIIIGRDLIIGVLREVGAAKKITIAADIWGKWKTTIQMIGICLLFIVNYRFINNWSVYSWQNQTVLIPIYIATLFTIISMINYIVKNINILKK